MVGYIVTRKRPALFRGRHFEDVIILLCVLWYLRYSLMYRDLEEIMAERSLSVDHVTIWRCCLRRLSARDIHHGLGNLAQVPAICHHVRSNSETRRGRRPISR